MKGKKGPQPGDPGYRPPRSVKERILSRIVVTESGCWEWQGPRDAKGYGNTFFGSRVDGTRRCARVHRKAYEAWVGPIPAGLTIDHLCCNKACANPAHLEPVTNQENRRRAADAQTHCRHGHPRTPDNIYVDGHGRRRCRTCLRAQRRARRAQARVGMRAA